MARCFTPAIATAMLVFAPVAGSTGEGPSPARVFEIRVLGSAGEALGGATVQVFTPCDAVEPLLAGSTDEHGSLRLGSSHTEFRAHASAVGYLTRTIGCTSLDALGASPLELKLIGSATLDARVEGPQGSVPEARVCLTLEGWERLPPDVLEHAAFDDGRCCATTDAAGRAGRQEIPSGTYDVRVEAEGLAPLATRIELDLRSAPLRWKLVRAAAIAGRLVDPQEDRGLEGALVRLEHALRDEDAETVTGSEGGFRVAGLAPGLWRLIVEPRGRVALLRDGLQLAAGATLDLGALPALPETALAGRVLGPDGDPVAGIEVRSYEPGSARKLLGRDETDEEGRFRLPFRAESAVTLVVLPDDAFAPSVLEDLEPTGPPPTIELAEAASVCGTVQSDERELPPRITVETRSPTSGWLQYLPALASKRTDEVDPATGQYCVHGVLPGDDIAVLARTAGFWSDPVEVDLAPGQRGNADLVLERGLALDGLVLAGGEPLPGAQVASAGAVARTDGAARFRLDGLHPGMNTVVASHPDYAPRAEELMLPRSDTDEPVAFDLEAGGRIVGRVSTADGRPAPHLALGLETDGGAQQAWTDDGGRYAFENVGPGSASVTLEAAHGNGEEVQTVEVASGGTTAVDFVLADTLEGRVLRDGLPVVGAAIAFARAADWQGELGDSYAVQLSSTDESGHYCISGVKRGWNTVEIRHGNQIVRRMVQVPEGEGASVDVTLPNHPLAGQVVSASTGAAIAGAVLRAHLAHAPGSPDGSASSHFTSFDPLGQVQGFSLTTEEAAETSSASDGSFLLWIDPIEKSKLFAFAKGFEYLHLTRVLRDPAPLAIELERSVNLIVRARDPNGRPLTTMEACCIVRRENSSSRTCNSGDATARFEQTEGAVTLLISAPGFGTLVEEIVLAAPEDGAPTEIERTLEPGAQLVVRLAGHPPDTARLVALVDPTGVDRTLLAESPQRVAADGDLVWTTRALAPGVWKVRVDTGHGDLVEREVAIVPGARIEMLLP